MVEYVCCPAPTLNPEVELNDTTRKYRSVLKLLVYGEFGAMIGQAYIFGIVSGAMHLFHVWIGYAAFATMNPCNVCIVGFCAGLELMMSFMNANDSST